MRSMLFINNRFLKTLCCFFSIGLYGMGITCEFSFAFNLNSFRWSDPALEPGKLIEVTNNYGDIRVRNSKRGGLGISAMIQNLREGQEEPRIKIIKNENTGGYRVTVTHSNEDKESGFYKGRVDMTLLVPLQSFIVATTTFGNIYIRFKGDLQASSVSGNLSIDTAGHIQAKTDSGKITTWLKGIKWSQPITFETESGNILIKLLNSASINVNARTKGHITTFPISDNKAINRTKDDALTWRFGDGDSKLYIQSVSGDVEIHELEASFSSSRDKAAPKVFKKDLRTLPRSKPWTPGQAIKETPRN